MVKNYCDSYLCVYGIMKMIIFKNLYNFLFLFYFLFLLGTYFLFFTLNTYQNWLIIIL
jgi:hypothetical protein